MGGGQRREAVGTLRRTGRLRDPRGRTQHRRRHRLHLGRRPPVRAGGAHGHRTLVVPVGDASATGGVPVRITVAEDGVAYVCAGSRVFALDAATGAERWRFDAPAAFLCPPAYVRGPGVTGGGIYLADYLGTVYALDTGNGHDRWRIATEARHSTEPVVTADGLVHLGSGSALYTLDAVSGTPRWRFATGADVVGAPVVANGRVHFGSADHCLYTVDAVGGQLRWKLATGGEITGPPVVVGGVVYACSKDRCVYALDATKGTGQSRHSA